VSCIRDHLAKRPIKRLGLRDLPAMASFSSGTARVAGSGTLSVIVELVRLLEKQSAPGCRSVVRIERLRNRHAASPVIDTCHAVRSRCSVLLRLLR
jgi:hypothetical protein